MEPGDAATTEHELTRKELTVLLDGAVTAARIGGDVLRAGVSVKKRVAYKGRVNLVTQVDTRSERAIMSYLGKRFPGHAFLAEESGSSARTSEFLWIIDPLDGTTNYAHGYRSYCVSIALSVGGTVVLGVVYDPNLDELFSAVEGRGARLNGKRISVSATASLSRSLLATGFPYDVRESRNNNLDHFSNFALRSQAVRRAGSAALDLCHTACGRFDGYWELKLGPWDVAAGSLMVVEAGGRVSDFKGGRFDIRMKELLASNGRIHGQMLDVLNA
ncbi:MAG: inositol monophosphatase [Candidatus Eisenbacteria bacterium]|nr:inositol monophosphatase [Candidatus Eisenbacteria bacterium]